MSFKNFFALLFIISFAIFLYFQFIHTPTPIEKIETPISKKGQIYQKSHKPSISIEAEFSGSDNFFILSSLITSVFSFFGFILSTYYSMRGHRRDEEIFSLQRERERLELDKIQAEIQALRGK